MDEGKQTHTRKNNNYNNKKTCAIKKGKKKSTFIITGKIQRNNI